MGASYRLQAASPQDRDFLYRLYASTRQEEMALTGWNQAQIDAFLQMQFRLQHRHYQTYYPNAAFDIIYIDNTPVGRLYVDRSADEIRLVDLTLLPPFRRRGIGATIFNDLIAESEKKGLPLRLHVEVNNPILPYYIKLGFTIIEDNGVYYAMERRARIPA
jgi:ribosomal protein S18 acetylase RimI-like enzyme